MRRKQKYHGGRKILSGMCSVSIRSDSATVGRYLYSYSATECAPWASDYGRQLRLDRVLVDCSSAIASSPSSVRLHGPLRRPHTNIVYLLALGFALVLDPGLVMGAEVYEGRGGRSSLFSLFPAYGIGRRGATWEVVLRVVLARTGLLGAAVVQGIGVIATPYARFFSRSLFVIMYRASSFLSPSAI
ncbi:hypothetical protein B0H16DRAFT_1734528 [Mycena metata]|uniref:Uncharacterized protein n=1 Tax=Mycena metata TaxID=1033252 RepID=A0AAD7HVU0_9AGAR|nr:hypothetical protein B0H16DRAFT_1734528 [Mycena metata]